MTDLQRIKLSVSTAISLGLAKNQEEVGKIMGYKSKSSFSQVINGKVPMPGTFIEKLKGLHENINKLWELDNFGNQQGPSLTEKGGGVPYYDIDFMAGFDLVYDTKQVNPSFYIDFLPFNDADCWINVTGKSMGPLIAHGDIVALKEVKDWRSFLLEGEIYAIVTVNGFRTIKMLGQGKDDDHYSLIAYNKSEDYKPQPIPKNVITHIFRVKGAIKKFF